MERTHLGRTGLVVSRLCLGTMNFGGHATEKESHAILDRALEAGVDFVDSANVYGGTAGKGASEEILGRWLSAAKGRREKVVVATKLYGGMGDSPHERGLSAKHVRHACEESLRRLATDYIDLYQMHHVELSTPFEETWAALQRLVDQGKVLHVGTSNFAAWQIVRMQHVAERLAGFGVVSEQSHYNLATRTVELEVLPACRALGIGVLPWSPLAGGLLGGVLDGGGGVRRASDKMRAPIEAHRERLQRYEALCRQLGRPPAAVALAWLLHQPGVTAPIVGPRTVGQLDAAFAAVDLVLDEAALEALDAIWPPAGEAPMAYAW